MIKNMKIRKSLILGYGVTVVVSVIIIIASIILMTIQKGQYTSILDNYVGANNIVSECRINSTSPDAACGTRCWAAM